ncbi:MULTISPECIES: hypothetical protein [unclassified Psychrobacter]|uniref:hypothetical protein n=1 Tax=unclassified Psychrobacter TaxID=196806 RepID=UPI0025B541AE|nr:MULTISPECIES: hypothetical protein [unclassified Psychrobacter]MDN3453610.1 hypothetical protein [Psychrobacter sp. APC 3350]MDN3501479.1 hypothetical protein [Psychrobacter sp. 5A.1]
MDDRVKNLDTPEKCKIFAKNALTVGREDLVKQAKERAIELKAEAYGAETSAEREAIKAVYAYEEVLSVNNGKKTRASRTWPMIQKYGIINAVERAVNRKAETKGYTVLLEMGLEAYAFEAVILRYPELFSENAVGISQQRMSEWKSI